MILQIAARNHLQNPRKKPDQVEPLKKYSGRIFLIIIG